MLVRLLRWRPTPNIGHNALAGAAYTLVYVLVLVEILTGFALFTHILGSRLWEAMAGWLVRLLDFQYVREIHFLIMLTFWMEEALGPLVEMAITQLTAWSRQDRHCNFFAGSA